MAIKPTSVDKTNTAKTALDEAVREVKLAHSYNYLGSHRSRPKTFSDKSANNNQNRIICNAPGRARSVELIIKQSDLRAGAYPQHNSAGSFSQEIEQLPSISFDEYRGMLTSIDLEKLGYQKKTISLTQKKLYKAAEQFAHIHFEAFKQMLCIGKKIPRDLEVWVKHSPIDNISAAKFSTETKVAYLNINHGFLQFVQIIRKDFSGNVTNLRHVAFDAGEPIVINESLLDQYGKMRQIAHVGNWGGRSEYLNSVERFDDGTALWTLTTHGVIYKSGSAALKNDGQIILLKDKLTTLHQTAARNLGAEGIDARTGRWSGDFDMSACVREADDRYILRREYKENIRKQVYQIIDGAAVPGLVPIFDI